MNENEEDENHECDDGLCGDDDGSAFERFPRSQTLPHSIKELKRGLEVEPS